VGVIISPTPFKETLLVKLLFAMLLLLMLLLHLLANECCLLLLSLHAFGTRLL
jgi:hypothetical protein